MQSRELETSGCTAVIVYALRHHHDLSRLLYRPVRLWDSEACPHAGLVEIATHDLRSFTHDRHRTVDDRPFGGGEGMVLKAQPIYDAVQSLHIAPKIERDRNRRRP